MIHFQKVVVSRGLLMPKVCVVGVVAISSLILSGVWTMKAIKSVVIVENFEAAFLAKNLLFIFGRLQKLMPNHCLGKRGGGIK